MLMLPRRAEFDHQRKATSRVVLHGGQKWPQFLSDLLDRRSVLEAAEEVVKGNQVLGTFATISLNRRDYPKLFSKHSLIHAKVQVYFCLADDHHVKPDQI